MNVESIRRVRADIAAHRAQYDQSEFTDPVKGVATCIASFAAARHRGVDPDEPLEPRGVRDDGQVYLGLTHGEACVLFHEEPPGIEHDMAGADLALEVLDACDELGRVPANVWALAAEGMVRGAEAA